jgi:hypothetical protein
MNFTMFDPDRSTPWATNWGFKPELPLARAFSRQPLYGLMVFFLRKWLARIRLTDEFIGVCRGDAIRTRKALEILKVRLADLVKADAFFLATAITSQQMEKEPATFASLELKLAIVAGRLESVSHRLSPSCSVADETSCGPVSVPRDDALAIWNAIDEKYAEAVHYTKGQDDETVGCSVSQVMTWTMGELRRAYRPEHVDYIGGRYAQFLADTDRPQ